MILETERLTPFDTQENDILKWEKQRTLNGSGIFIGKWWNVDTGRMWCATYVNYNTQSNYRHYIFGDYIPPKHHK